MDYEGCSPEYVKESRLREFKLAVYELVFMAFWRLGMIAVTFIVGFLILVAIDAPLSTIPSLFR